MPPANCWVCGKFTAGTYAGWICERGHERVIWHSKPRSNSDAKSFQARNDAARKTCKEMGIKYLDGKEDYDRFPAPA